MNNFDIDSLLNLSPVEFEELIKTLLTKMQFKASTTKVSGDGGIDVIATSEQPIVGGKYVVQCKRYKSGNNIGEPTVRELYGVMMHECANKGILITTSNFTKQAAIFSQNKAIELINGVSILCLLNKYLGAPSGPENLSIVNPIGQFTVSDMVIIDEVMELVWARNADLSDKVNWYDAHELIEKLNRQKYAGYTEWRIPAIDELTSLLDCADRQRGNDSINKFLNKVGFKNIISGYLESYWSSSTSDSENYAWSIIMGDNVMCGDKGPSNKQLSKNFIWPVCNRQG